MQVAKTVSVWLVEERGDRDRMGRDADRRMQRDDGQRHHQRRGDQDTSDALGGGGVVSGPREEGANPRHQAVGEMILSDNRKKYFTDRPKRQDGLRVPSAPATVGSSPRPTAHSRPRAAQ
jgi:hypothetical protein